MLNFDRSVHPRVRVSKQKITDALFFLLNEKKLDDITIADIIGATAIKDTYGVAVGRQTFYAHFNSKSDVIEDYFMGFFKNSYLKIKLAKESLPLGHKLSMRSFDIIFSEFEPVRKRIMEIFENSKDPGFVSSLNSVAVKTATLFLSDLYRNVFNLKEDSPEDELFYNIIINMSSGSIAAIFSSWLVGKYTGNLKFLIEYVSRYNLVALTYSTSVYEFKLGREKGLDGFIDGMKNLDPDAKDALFYKSVFFKEEHE